jgi:hypothetical protein
VSAEPLFKLDVFKEGFYHACYTKPSSRSNVKK